MEQIRAAVDFSFQEIERLAWQQTLDCFREALVEALSAIDTALYESRDPSRYVYKEMRSRNVVTKFGPITFQRRYYWDREEERFVFLLDEVLGIAKRQRVSDSVRADAVEASVTAGSYRGAAAELERRDCQVFVSHEAIRQCSGGKTAADDVGRYPTCAGLVHRGRRVLASSSAWQEGRSPAVCDS